MATTLKQIQTQKQKLAPRQVLRARLLQLNTVSLEQAILEELEQNPLLEQVEPEDTQLQEEKKKHLSMIWMFLWKICIPMNPPIIFLKRKRTCLCPIGIH